MKDYYVLKIMWENAGKATETRYFCEKRRKKMTESDFFQVELNIEPTGAVQNKKDRNKYT